VLAKLRDRRIQASEEEVVRSLEGTGATTCCSTRRQVVEGYDFYQRQMEACDQELQRYLAVLPDRQEGKHGLGSGCGADEAV